jgi:hypothetical protein
MTAINIPEAINPSDHKAFDNTPREIPGRSVHELLKLLVGSIAKLVYSDQAFLDEWCEAFLGEIETSWERVGLYPTQEEMVGVYLDPNFLPKMVRTVRDQSIAYFDGSDGSLVILVAAAECIKERRERDL